MAPEYSDGTPLEGNDSVRARPHALCPYALRPRPRTSERTEVTGRRLLRRCCHRCWQWWCARRRCNHNRGHYPATAAAAATATTRSRSRLRIAPRLQVGVDADKLVEEINVEIWRCRGSAQ